jgi:protoporphyrinogen oxidase
LNAEQALIQLYGKPLYKFFFEDFTHRYWGIHPTEISASFVASKMPKLTAVDVLKRGLSKIGIKSKARSTESALAYETLSYSRTGAETMTRCIADAVKSKGGEVICQAEVKQINNDGTKITGIIYEKEGARHELICDAFISTIPISELIKRSEPQPPKEVFDSANKLHFKPIVVVGLLVNKPKCLDCLYVYYRDQVFHRLGEPKNAGMEVTPSDHTVLIVEMTCNVGDARWAMDDNVKEKIFNGLEKQKICHRDDIVEMHVSRYTEGYPIYALGFEPAIDTVKDHIKAWGNIITTGRQGGFTYPNMHSAMRMGADAADEIVKTL